MATVGTNSQLLVNPLNKERARARERVRARERKKARESREERGERAREIERARERGDRESKRPTVGSNRQRLVAHSPHQIICTALLTARTFPLTHSPSHTHSHTLCSLSHTPAASPRGSQRVTRHWTRSPRFQEVESDDHLLSRWRFLTATPVLGGEM